MTFTITYEAINNCTFLIKPYSPSAQASSQLKSLVPFLISYTMSEVCSIRQAQTTPSTEEEKKIQHELAFLKQSCDFNAPISLHGLAMFHLSLLLPLFSCFALSWKPFDRVVIHVDC